MLFLVRRGWAHTSFHKAPWALNRIIINSPFNILHQSPFYMHFYVGWICAYKRLLAYMWISAYMLHVHPLVHILYDGTIIVKYHDRTLLFASSRICSVNYSLFFIRKLPHINFINISYKIKVSPINWYRIWSSHLWKLMRKL